MGISHLAPIAALQLSPLRRAGTELGAPGDHGASRHCHLLLVIADTAGTAVSHRAAYGLAGGGHRGAVRGAGDVPAGLAGAQLAGKVDVEGEASGDTVVSEALYLTVIRQVGGAGAGRGAGWAAAPRGGLRAGGAGAGVTDGCRGSTPEQEAAQPQAECTGRSHAAGEKKQIKTKKIGVGITPGMGTPRP